MQPPSTLAPPVALVTGAARRVGRAIALALAQRGCDIAIHYFHSRDDAEATAADVRALGRRAATLPADLADPVAVAALPKQVAAALGRLDLLVNNASIFEPMPLDAVDFAAWQRTFTVNLAAPALIVRHAAELLATSGRGAIVNVADISAERPWPNYLAYCASKAGLVNLTRALARRLAPRIRVNAVSPGIAEWPADFDAATREKLIARVPALRAGSAEEVAAVVAFLVLDAVHVTGVVLPVDGGRSVAL